MCLLSQCKRPLYRVVWRARPLCTCNTVAMVVPGHVMPVPGHVNAIVPGYPMLRDIHVLHC